jgi:hypothetical protein
MSRASRVLGMEVAIDLLDALSYLEKGNHSGYGSWDPQAEVTR